MKKILIILCLSMFYMGCQSQLNDDLQNLQIEPSISIQEPKYRKGGDY